MSRTLVAVPTWHRDGYLDVALASIAPQAAAAGADLLVIVDGPDPASVTVARRHGARVLTRADRGGANAARNLALRESDAELVVFVDDDIEAEPGWLAALLDAATRLPEHDVFGGPIRPWLERPPRHCGREPAPITALDLGPGDCDTRYVWSANMAIRRRAHTRVGPFLEAIHGRGEEEEWLDRLHRGGGRVRYVAAAAVRHRRTGDDARLSALARAGFALGASARANDVRKAAAPTLRGELRLLAGALWHTLARRCGYGVVFCAHALGRISETLAPQPAPPTRDGDFVSGFSGLVAGRRAVTLARARDGLVDVWTLPRRRRLRRDAAVWGTPRRVQVLALERPDRPNILGPALAELGAGRHDVAVLRGAVGDRGRFENLNRLLGDPGVTLADRDWLIILDDDVALPRGFLDAFLFLAERWDLALAQPAHRRLSHAAWPVTRRHGGAVLRETHFVEIGPLVAFHRRTFSRLLPFPGLRVGWGVDAHWGAVALAEGWRCGVVDATAMAHYLRPVAASYDATAAVAEMRAFLAAQPHITPAQAARTLRTHRSW
ncbi:MAG TPA: glycosyltransferase [Solirubrobacteraceae bacterium]|nr:glycosyltransferase [Solirubrobacteraceae bacterium]